MPFTWFTSVRSGLLASLLLPLLFTVPAAAQATEEVVDEIVAVVGDGIVLRSEVDAYALGIAQQQQLPYSDEIWAGALGQLINQKVISVHAKRDTNLTVTDEQVEEALEQRVRQLTAQVGSEARIEEIYGKSVARIKDEMRGDFRDRLLADQLQSAKMQDVQVTPSEVKAWFSQFPADSLPVLPDVVRIAHIVRYPEITAEARQDAMDIISAVRDSVVSGNGTIESYATRFTDDTGSAQTGGRYAGSRLTDLAPEFAAVAARIPIGEVSQPFETQFGLHILRVNERRGDVVDFNHILIAFDADNADPTEALAYLKTVRDSITTNNMPFELMARRHSEEQFSSIRGGRVVDPNSTSRDLPLNALGTSWRRTIADLDEGELSEPAEVELLDGKRAYHVLLLQKRVPSHRVDIITDYERIQEIALQEKQQRVLSEWIEELRKDVYVEVRGKAQDLTSIQ